MDAAGDRVPKPLPSGRVNERGEAGMDDVEAIKQLKARYCRLMDTKDWAGYRRLFTDDVTMDTTDSGGSVITGADDFLVFLTATIGDVVTVHQCHTPEIQVSLGTTATGIWAMEDMLRFADGSELHGYGHYHETYEKVSDEWLIKSSTLTRLRMDFTAAS
jgi:ketosteroid isomerase-like protein